MASISKRLNSICYTCLPFLTSPRKSHNKKPIRISHAKRPRTTYHRNAVDYLEDEVMTIVYCLCHFEVFGLLNSLLIGLDSTGCERKMIVSFYS
ncbi:hypothetical protein EYC80_000647 [Monilinia laxa]|uniref:Uncharacterized protein n=1 Tax=Monilinia laxa TaxID=61186 RepID=A0A5N6KCH7_MONLA|nr:hypothetical protein EYC80_000647 [Monilinia laxa]